MSEGPPPPARVRVMYSVSRLPDWILAAQVLQRERGWEPVYWTTVRGNHDEVGRTYAAMTPEEKDARSHRGAAFRALAAHLAGREV